MCGEFHPGLAICMGSCLMGTGGLPRSGCPLPPAHQHRYQPTLWGPERLLRFQSFCPNATSWQAFMWAYQPAQQQEEGGGRGAGGMTAVSWRQQGGKQEERGAGGGQAPGKDVPPSGRLHRDGHRGLAQVPHGACHAPCRWGPGLGVSGVAPGLAVSRGRAGTVTWLAFPAQGSGQHGGP